MLSRQKTCQFFPDLISILVKILKLKTEIPEGGKLMNLYFNVLFPCYKNCN